MADLYDKLTRHQVYLEQVKTWQGADFNDTLDVLSRRLNTIIFEQTKDVAEMTAAEYRNFRSRLSRQLDSTLARSKSVMLSDYEQFSKVDNEVLRKVLGSERTTRRRMPTNKTLWNQARKRLVGANGLTLEQTLTQYYASVKADVLGKVGAARVNATTMRELKEQIGVKGAKSGLLNKWKNQANSVIATSLQHVSSVTQSYYEAIFYERYRWVSVIDEKTTDVCKSRDGKTWAYGKGPIPPAHYNCRSKIVPVEENKRNIPSSFFEWLKTQPLAFLTDIVGKVAAKRIKSGKAKAVEFPKFMSSERLPLDKFADKLSFILAD